MKYQLFGMKYLHHLIAFLTTMMVSNRIQSEDPFTVDCVSKNLAFLYTNVTEYRVTLPRGCPYIHSEGNYTLGSDCLSETKMILVFPKLISRYDLTGGRSTRVFTVICTDKLDETGTRMTASASVQIVTVPTIHHYHLPVPRVRLFITDVDPKSAASALPGLSAGHSVNLGQKLYLVIESPRQSQGYYEFFLPEHCEAISSPPLNLTLQLWNKTSCDRNCIEQPKLMDPFTVYKNGKSFTDSVSNLAYAPIYTFHFPKMYVHGNTIRYTCTFLVCPRSSERTGHCEQELQRLSSNSTQCIKLNTSPVRRIRQVHTGSSEKMEIKTLSTTIRIRLFSLEESQADPSTKTIVIVTTSVMVPVIVITAVVVVSCTVWGRRRKKKKAKQTVQEIEFDITSGMY